MNLDKAIEILYFLIGPGMPKINLDERDAIKLGEEALKRISDNRDCGNSLIDEPLPGETED